AEAGAFTDTSGNPMARIAGKTAWAFKTADLTPPTVTTTSPANNETIMTKTGAISLTFSEDVKAAAGKNVVLRKTSDDSAVFTYAANDTSKVTISGGTVTLANPGIDDANGYYLEVDAGAFTDLAGNPYAGISGKTTWTFTIPDLTDPTVTALTPAASASNADATTELKLIFSEAVTAAAGKTITIHKASDDSVVYTYQADDTGHVSITGNQVVLQNPALEPMVSYYILVQPGAFLDAANHQYAGITSKTGWFFTTINAVSVTATVDAPLDELSLTQGAAIYVTVTGNTFLDSASASDFVLNQAPQGLTIAGAGKMGEDTAFLILDFDKTYFANNFDHVSITVKGSAMSGGQDAQTNELSIQAAPTLAQATVFPANHSTLSSLEATFSLTYSEDVKAVANKFIRIYNAATNNLVETIAATDNAKVTIKNNVVTIAHSALSPGTQYYVQMDAWAFESTTGTPAAGMTTTMDWKFTTADLSTVAYISDVVIGSNGRAAIQVFGNNVDNAGMNSGYELFFHQYVHATNQVRVWSLPFLPFYPGMPYIVLNSNFYDFFDITNAAYFNEEAYFELSGYTLNALVLKKDGVIVDVVGDPTATTQKGILTSGGTLVRKKNTMKGSTTFSVNEWDSYPKDTFMFLGRHTQ
ncbi:UNVERIFIED_CONTAM: methionine-rich copper-binding protein CopC, partial [Paenibacillus phyllosphaerae]